MAGLSIHLKRPIMFKRIVHSILRHSYIFLLDLTVVSVLMPCVLASVCMQFLTTRSVQRVA